MNDRSYNVYKGLQRPIQFKGLKGNYIYYAFALALVSLVVGVIFTMFSSILVGSTSIVVVAFGGIIGMALYQRKYGLYRKNAIKGTFIFHSIFNKY